MRPARIFPKEVTRSLKSLLKLFWISVICVVCCFFGVTGRSFGQGISGIPSTQVGSGTDGTLICARPIKGTKMNVNIAATINLFFIK